MDFVWAHIIKLMRRYKLNGMWVGTAKQPSSRLHELAFIGYRNEYFDFSSCYRFVRSNFNNIKKNITARAQSALIKECIPVNDWLSIKQFKWETTKQIAMTFRIVRTLNAWTWWNGLRVRKEGKSLKLETLWGKRNNHIAYRRKSDTRQFSP